VISGSALWDPSLPTALLALMVAGHVLADFLFQTRRGVEARRRGTAGLLPHLSHGGIVLAVHLAVLLPLISLAVAAVMVGASILHVVIDRAKDRWIPIGPERLKPFVLDQAAHLGIILAGWWLLVAFDAIPALRWLSEPQLGTWLGGAILASAFAFNAIGGGVLVEGVLGLLPADGDGEGAGAAGGGAGGRTATGGPMMHAVAGRSAEGAGHDAGHKGAGRLIGILERTLMLPMILYGQWGAIGLLLAAKSIARFEELKVRKFAEYYLVGTLMSLLVALAVGAVLTEILFPLMR
jgi:hypothetical protein